MSRSNQPGTPSNWITQGIASISKGGTGASNELTAAANLGGIYSPSLGLALYATKSLDNGLVNPSELPDAIVVGAALYGPNNLYPTQVVSYLITNFDSLSSYDVSVSAGSCILNNDTITFTAPSSSQIVTLTINGRSVPITVQNPWPIKPTVIVTTSGSNNLASAVLTSSPFAMIEGNPTHRCTNWEIAYDSGFTNMVAEDLDDQYNKLSWTYNWLAPDTTYYARCCYCATNGVLSSWSDSVVFTTKSRYSPTSEEAKLAASDKSANASFGWNLDIDQDGTRVVIGAYLSSPNSEAYIFKRTGTTWTQEAKLIISNVRLGYSVSIDSTGTRVALGAPYYSGVKNQAGGVYVFTRSGTTWTQEQILTASDAATKDNLGMSISINGDGSRIAVGVPYAKINTAKTAGGVYIFSRTGIVWTQEIKLTASDGVTNDNFGNSVKINFDSSRIAVGAYLASNGSLSNAGAVYIFTRSGTTWAQEVKLQAAGGSANDQFGYSVSFSLDASRVVIGANQSSSSGISKTGAVYTYVRSGTTWTFEYKLMAFDKATNDLFGTSVDINQEGNKIAIGSMQAAISNKTNAGAAYIFNLVGSIWVQETKLNASDYASGDLYGCCVALSNDSSHLAIGSYQESPGGTSKAGSAYIYS